MTRKVRKRAENWSELLTLRAKVAELERKNAELELKNEHLKEKAGVKTAVKRRLSALMEHAVDSEGLTPQQHRWLSSRNLGLSMQTNDSGGFDMGADFCITFVHKRGTVFEYTINDTYHTSGEFDMGGGDTLTIHFPLLGRFDTA